MDQVDSDRIDLDLDIDLESGETSEEDASKVNRLSYDYSRNLLDGEDRWLLSDSSGSVDGRNCSCSSENVPSSDENSAKEMQPGNFRWETVSKGNPKKLTYKIHPKPPRPPKGPSLNPSDMKLLKEISELNLQRKRMERVRTLRKTKKEKPSSVTSNIFALLVTIIFFLVIIFQGLLGSRM